MVLQSGYKNTDISKRKYWSFKKHSELIHLHFSSGCWLFSHEPWSCSRAQNTTKEIWWRQSVKHAYRFPQMTWNTVKYTLNIKLPWHVEKHVHRTSPGFWSPGHRCHRNGKTLVPSYFSAVGYGQIGSPYGLSLFSVHCCCMTNTIKVMIMI